MASHVDLLKSCCLLLFQNFLRPLQGLQDTMLSSMRHQQLYWSKLKYGLNRKRPLPLSCFSLLWLDILFVTIPTVTFATIHGGYVHSSFNAIILTVAQKIRKTGIMQSRLLLSNPQVWETLWPNSITAMGNTFRAKKEREASPTKYSPAFSFPLVCSPHLLFFPRPYMLCWSSSNLSGMVKSPSTFSWQKQFFKFHSAYDHVHRNQACPYLEQPLFQVVYNVLYDIPSRNNFDKGIN